MWKRSFRARRPKKCALKMLKQSLWKRSFRARLLSKTLRFLCCETSLLWDFFAVRLLAVRSLCCETSLLWDFFAVRLLAVRLLCCETSLLCDFFSVGFQSLPKIHNREVRHPNFLWWYDMNWCDMIWHDMMDHDGMASCWAEAEKRTNNEENMAMTVASWWWSR